jgi:hypothetical protein|tara:strand:- start:579 stop:791 length:213 start_codon:yes stop_codon:yes gene_type:complete
MIEIQKNSREVIRVSASEYEGHNFIDLRIWYDDDGEMKPTKKGISFNPSKAEEVIEGILKVTEETNWKNF